MEAKFSQKEQMLLGKTHRMMLDGKTAEEISVAIKRDMEFVSALMKLCEQADKELDRRIQEKKEC